MITIIIIADNNALKNDNKFKFVTVLYRIPSFCLRNVLKLYYYRKNERNVYENII